PLSAQESAGDLEAGRIDRDQSWPRRHDQRGAVGADYCSRRLPAWGRGRGATDARLPWVCTREQPAAAELGLQLHHPACRRVAREEGGTSGAAHEAPAGGRRRKVLTVGKWEGLALANRELVHEGFVPGTPLIQGELRGTIAAREAGQGLAGHELADLALVRNDLRVQRPPRQVVHADLIAALPDPLQQVEALAVVAQPIEGEDARQVDGDRPRDKGAVQHFEPAGGTGRSAGESEPGPVG